MKGTCGVLEEFNQRKIGRVLLQWLNKSIIVKYDIKIVSKWL